MSKSQALTETLSRLITKQSFFATILMEQMVISESQALPTAATDGRRMIFNPEFLKVLLPKQREFVACHEVLHAIYRHMPRAKMYMERNLGPDMKPFSMKRYGIAADYVINATLIESKIGQMPTGEFEGLHNSKYTASWSADEVYIDLANDEGDEPGDKPGEGRPCPDGDQPGDRPGSQPGEGTGEGFDEHLMPEAGVPEITEQEMKRAIQSAKNAAQAVGQMPAALERLIDTLLDPELPWPEVLQEEMTVTAGRDQATWAKPNRRRLALAPHTYMPGTTGFQVGGVCVVVDVSGSVSNDMVRRFLSEVSGILVECTPQWMRVLWTDTRVAHVDEVDDAEELANLTAHGGGGTDMEAAFRHIEEEDYDPDVVVVLTDGYTHFTEAPAFPVIWGITTDVEPPYGKVIKVNEQ